MKTSTAKELAVQWFERVWQHRDKAAIHELLHEQTEAHQPGGGVIKGPAEFDQFHDQVTLGFPDHSLKILHVVGDDTQAALHWEMSGTHTGIFMGMAPTQKKVTFDGMTFLTVANGKVTEGWDCWDMTGLMASLAKG